MLRDELAQARTVIEVTSSQLNRGNTVPPTRYSSPTDEIAFSILRSANPPSTFISLLVRELDTGQIGWQRRILRTLSQPQNLASGQDLMPVTEWIDREVLNAEQENELLDISANFYWDLINLPSTDEALRLNLLNRLARCKALGPAFWLDTKRINDVQRPSQFNGPQFVLFPPAKCEIEKQAIAVLASPDAKSSFKVQATIYLRLLHSPMFDRFGMDDTRRVVFDAIRTSLHHLSNSRSDLLAASPIPASLVSSTALVDEINSQARLEVLKPSGQLRQQISWAQRRDTFASQSFLSVELLELIRVMNASTEFSPELLKLYMATAEQNEQLNAFLDANAVREITWPGMVPTPGSSATTDQWIAGLIRIRALRLLAPETQAELTQLAQRTYQSQATELLLAKFDENKDGVLSVKESAGIAESIENFDLNRNGTLEEGELLEFIRTVGTQPNFATNQVLAVDDRALDWAVKQITKYDKNGDGQLTIDEWSSMLIRPDGADVNGDGAITALEFANSRQIKK
jgi:Ca2+-binding EF-hand superfamily protein